jgi:hypothetical protein
MEKPMTTDEIKAFVFDKLSAFDGLPMEETERILGMMTATMISQHPREEWKARMTHFTNEVWKCITETNWDPTTH